MKWVLIVVGLVLGKIVEEAVTRYLSVRERSRRPYEVNGYTIGPGADLRRADLFEADLEGANLSGADLNEANLNEADFSNAALIETCAISQSGRARTPLSVSPSFVELADRQLARKRPCISDNHRP